MMAASSRGKFVKARLKVFVNIFYSVLLFFYFLLILVRDQLATRFFFLFAEELEIRLCWILNLWWRKTRARWFYINFYRGPFYLDTSCQKEVDSLALFLSLLLWMYVKCWINRNVRLVKDETPRSLLHVDWMTISCFYSRQSDTHYGCFHFFYLCRVLMVVAKSKWIKNSFVGFNFCQTFVAWRYLRH